MYSIEGPRLFLNCRRIIADNGGPVYTAFVALEVSPLYSGQISTFKLKWALSWQTREQALSLVGNPAAKILRYGVQETARGDKDPRDGQEDRLTIELVQGVPRLTVRLNKTWDATETTLPGNHRGRPLSNKVFYERYLEPCGQDSYGRQKFWVRCRVDLAANPVLVVKREREQTVRSFYPDQIFIQEPLVLDMASSASEEAAIRLLCEPFGEIDAILPTAGSSGERRGYDVKYADRNAAARAQQQLCLFAGVFIQRQFGLPDPSGGSNSLTVNSNSVSRSGAGGIRTAAGLSFAPSTQQGHNEAPPRMRETQRSTSDNIEDWPALPSVKGSEASQTLSASIEDGSTPGISLPATICDNQEPLTLKVLSPIEEEPREATSYYRQDITEQPQVTALGPEDHGVRVEAMVGSARRKDSPRNESKYPNMPDPDPTELSALGLIDVLPLDLNDRGTVVTPGQEQSNANDRRMMTNRTVPIVSLGNLKRGTASPEAGSAIKRMTLEVQDLSSDETEETVRERFKSYGRIVSRSVSSP